MYEFKSYFKVQKKNNKRKRKVKDEKETESVITINDFLAFKERIRNHETISNLKL